MSKIKQRKIIFIVAGVLFLLGLVASIVLLSVYYNKRVSSNEYAIVFDAGSSGTRMYIYTWPGGLSAANGDQVNITEVANVVKSGGIDKITSKDNLIIYLNDMMTKARVTVPNDRKNRTFICLGATAGMRLLESANKVQSDTILNYTRDLFSASEFLYKGPEQVQIITGKDEGINAWISTNYYLNNFNTKTNPLSTVGTLDLGGASTQVVFTPSSIPTNNQSLMSDYYGNLRIYGVNFTPYSYSFLCWGANQILLIYQTSLIIQNNYATNINAACYPSGFSVNVTKAAILASNCANGLLFKFPTTLDTTLLNQNNYYTITGTSNYDNCMNEMSILYPSTTCNYGSCSFNGIYIPAIDSTTQFYAFSSFFYQFNNTQTITKKPINNNLQEFISQTKTICNSDFSTLSQMNNGAIQSSFLSTICFTNNYAAGLFAKYKITSTDNVKITDNINGNTVGWTLGYLFSFLNRNDFLPYEAPVRSLPTEFFIPTITVVSVLTFFAIIGIVACILWL